MKIRIASLAATAALPFLTFLQGVAAVAAPCTADLARAKTLDFIKGMKAKNPALTYSDLSLAVSASPLSHRIQVVYSFVETKLPDGLGDPKKLSQRLIGYQIFSDSDCLLVENGNEAAASMDFSGNPVSNSAPVSGVTGKNSKPLKGESIDSPDSPEKMPADTSKAAKEAD